MLVWLAEHAEKMNLLSSFRLATSSAWCAALLACAGGGEPAPATVVRTLPPKGYEKTITHYLAFRIRNPQKNSEISIGQPEPGGCPLDGYLTSARGWVVPVVYATRKGEVTGRETIYITTKQYYFWFLGDTIAGITPRIELCPGVGSAFNEPTQPSPAAAGLLTTAFPSPTKPDAPGREAADTPEKLQDRAKMAGGQKQVTAHKTKKTRTSAGAARQAGKKVANSRAKAKTEAKQ
jgi:hypothetical protein